MVNPESCPECGAYDTERVYQDWHTVEVIEVRICNECPTEYEVVYGQPLIQTTHTE